MVVFVTFRLADSIPKERLAEWDEERRRWLVARGKITRPDLQETLAELTPEERVEYLRQFGRRFHAMLDECHGTCALRLPACGRMMEEVLLHFDGVRYLLGEYVVMPNHVHVLMAPLAGYGVNGIVRSWKAHSAVRINRLMGTKGQVWQRESFDHLVRDGASLRGFERYVIENPGKAALRNGEFWQGRGSMPVV